MTRLGGISVSTRVAHNVAFMLACVQSDKDALDRLQMHFARAGSRHRPSALRRTTSVSRLRDGVQLITPVAGSPTCYILVVRTTSTSLIKFFNSGSSR